MLLEYWLSCQFQAVARLIMLLHACCPTQSASKTSKDVPSSSRVAPEEVRASAPWLSYFTRLLRFMLCCFKAWATARLAPQAGAKPEEGVPGVHLMPDMYAARQYVRLHQVLGVAGKLMALTQVGAWHRAAWSGMFIVCWLQMQRSVPRPQHAM